MVDFKHEDQGRQRYMCSRGSIWALTKSGELGVLFVFVEDRSNCLFLY